MFSWLGNAWRVPELRRRVLFTAIILALYPLVNIFGDRILVALNNISVGWHLLGVAVIIALRPPTWRPPPPPGS